MMATSIEASTPLSPGRDLWIVADAEHSKWSRKIDWHLNFQIMKAEGHQAIAPAEELKTIESEWGVARAQIRVSESAPLLIASAALLPNRQTVMIPYKGDVERWITKCSETWLGLHQPTLRIFLPDSVRPDVAHKQWSKAAGKAGADAEFISGSTEVHSPRD